MTYWEEDRTEFIPGDLVLVRYPVDGRTDSDPESWPWLPAIVLDEPQDPADREWEDPMDHWNDPPVMGVVLAVGTLAFTVPDSHVDALRMHQVNPDDVLAIPAIPWQREVARYLRTSG